MESDATPRDDMRAIEATALAHAAAGRFAEALALFERVAAHLPGSAAAAANCGAACANLLRMPEARKWYERALAIEPQNPNASLGLGSTLRILGELDGAIAAFDRVLARDPGNFAATFDRANALQNAGRLADAEAGFKRALELKPGNSGAFNNLGLLRADQARHSEALEYFAAAHAEHGWLFTLNYHPEVAPETLTDAYKAWGSRHAAPLRATWPAYPAVRAPKERLRVGVVSYDLRIHSMTHFLLPALANLDPARIELHLYYNADKIDAVTARYQALTKHFVRISDMDDTTAAARIAADGIDVLVDASGHTSGNRLTLFARKPAPVQVTWLAYGTTTGMDAIDWFLADERFVPPGGEKYFTEGVWRLPAAFCYAPPEALPPVAPLPATNDGAITFGCFSRTIRLNDRTLAVWGSILRRLPDCRLMLDSLPFACPVTRADFENRLIRFGARRRQLTLGYTTPQPRVWDAYAKVDVALDPFPHNAGATTFEALWLGVPVISKRDRIPLGRFGDSILGAAGLGDWVVDDEKGYVDRALAAASDVAGLAALRAGMRGRLEASLLGDTKRFGRTLTDAFHAMWNAPDPRKP